MTRYRFAVLGDPVEHSRSPQLHAAMLELTGLDGEYVKIRADETILEEVVEASRRGEWDGLNVTMPLKAAAARLADSLSPLAHRSGSVNTLVPSKSEIMGHSTDAIAFRELYEDARFRDATSTLVLGAGGAAAAALCALPEDHRVYVSARRMKQAEDLTGRLGGEVIPWGTAVAGALVVNTTPMGMAGESLPEHVIEVAGSLIDLPYAPATTSAVATASRLRIPHSDGHEFLQRQAIGSFRLWTGVDVGLKTLDEALRNI